MLVVDLHPLEAVDLLDFIHQVAGQFLDAADVEDVVGVGGAVHQLFAGPHEVAFLHGHVLAFGDQVLLGLAHLRGDDDLAFPLDVLPERNHPADFADDGGLFGFAHLEELRHPGQAAGDILGLGRLPGDLGNDVAGEDLVALAHHEDGAHRHEIAGIGD